ncbi:MAG: hypothetical protein ACK4YP_10255, partial [Myxococcota bacterium]
MPIAQNGVMNSGNSHHCGCARFHSETSTPQPQISATSAYQTPALRAGSEMRNPPPSSSVTSNRVGAKGTFVTAMPKPQTIHDFGGFPQALYDVQ